MRKKILVLLAAVMALMSFTANSQSSHDAADRDDYDLGYRQRSRFELGAPDSNFRLGIRGLLQQNLEFSQTLNQGSGLSMELKRAQLSFSGVLFSPRYSYLISVGLINPNTNVFGEKETILNPDNNKYENTKGVNPIAINLLDFYANAVLYDHIQLRIGQFRTPFTRAALTSAAQTQFYDANRANRFFQTTPGGRDMGVMFHNGFNKRIEWAAAAVGTGIVGRVGYNHGEIDGYEMVDWTRGPLRYGVALNGFFGSDFRSVKLVDARVGIDGIVKISGFSGNAAIFYQGIGGDKPANNFGLGLDGGYRLLNNWEPVGRYAFVKHGDVQEHEILGGVNRYIYGHHFKLQGYGGADLNNKKDLKWKVGAQLQLAI